MGGIDLGDQFRLSLLGEIPIDGQLAVGFMGPKPEKGPVIQLQEWR